MRRHLLVVLKILRTPPFSHLIERRLRDVEMPFRNQLRHLPEKERQQQRPNMRPIYIRIRHNNHLRIAELLKGKLLRTDARA